MNSLSQTWVIQIEGTHNNPGMIRLQTMQANEMLSIDRH